MVSQIHNSSVVFIHIIDDCYESKSSKLWIFGCVEEMVLKSKRGMSQGQLWFIILLILALILLFPSTAFGKKLVNTSEVLFTGTCKFVKIPLLCEEESISAGAAGVAGHNLPNSQNIQTGVVVFDEFNKMLRDRSKTHKSVFSFVEAKEMFLLMKCIHKENVNNQNVFVFKSTIDSGKIPVYFVYRDNPVAARNIGIFGLTVSDSNDNFMYRWEDMMRSSNGNNFDGWYQSAVATTFMWIDDAQPVLGIFSSDVRMDANNIKKYTWGISSIKFSRTPQDYILDSIKKGCGNSVQTTP